MLRPFILGILILATAIGPIAAQESTPGKRIEIHRVDDVVTVWSLGHAPAAKATHAFVLTHGLGGIDERFYEMGQAILKQYPDANVLVVDWSPGAVRKIARIPNPLAAADRIDLTGDLLGLFLTRLHKKNGFDPTQATFIGESFGNCVNHRAALCLRKNGLKKPQCAVVLNPAPAAGYQTPVFTVAFKQSIACVSDSLLDTRAAIANKRVLLKPDSRGQIDQHTHGMRWLQARIDAGESIGSLFTAAKTNPSSLAR
jgi:hypothetical protein